MKINIQSLKKGADIDVDVQSITNSLNKIYDDLNRMVFNSELIKVEITVSPRGKRNAYGWYTLDKRWTSDRHEINICSEYLDKGLYHVAGVLLHEMVHHYNNSKGIKDYSRGGTYHNKKFEVEALRRYLSVSFDKKYGYAFKDLSNEGREIIDELNYQDVFSIRKEDTALSEGENGKEGGEGRRRKSNSFKYMCPYCNTIVRATKEVDILCGSCLPVNGIVQMVRVNYEEHCD